MSTSTTPTLLEDWEQRRELLSASREPSEFAEVQRRVLDYLIKRYGRAPEAQRTAKFPAIHEVYVNERAVLVYHHVGRHIVGGVKTPREAEDRVSSILYRLTEPETDEESTRAPPAPLADDAKTPDIADELNLDPLALEHMSTDRVRLLLADPNPHTRLRALRLLGEIGDLDDIGLLMDLLALAPSADEAPGEREAMMRTINVLSGCAEPEPEPEMQPIVNVVATYSDAGADDWGTIVGWIVVAVGLIPILGITITLMLHDAATTPIQVAAVMFLSVLAVSFVTHRVYRIIGRRRT